MNAMPWFILILVTLIWYAVVTVVVAIRGAKNIKQLFEDQESAMNQESATPFSM